MGTKVDIEKTLHSYLCKKCLLSFDMLKSDYFALIGVLPCNFLILKIWVFMVVVRVDRPRGLDSWTVPVWSPKNKELFRNGLMDCPRVEP